MYNTRVDVLAMENHRMMLSSMAVTQKHTDSAILIWKQGYLQEIPSHHISNGSSQVKGAEPCSNDRLRAGKRELRQ